MQLTAYIDAYSTDDGVSPPDFATINVDEGFLVLLKRLVGVVSDNQLTSVACNACPDAWMPEKVANDLDLFGDELHIGHSTFWFEACVEHCEAIIKTRGIDINLFFKEVDEAVKNGVTELFLGSDEDYLRSRVEAALDRSDDENAEEA